MTIATYPSLKDRHVVVTGGGSGIGACIVEHFARQGSRVTFFDIADEPSLELAERLSADAMSARYIRCDLSDVDAIRAAMDDARTVHGPVSILINNAANDQRHELSGVTGDYWDDRMAVNLKAQFFAAQAVVDDMKAAGGGAIICLGSTSWMIGQGGMVAYTTAKSAIAGLTRSLARDLGPFGIRVCCVAPGWIMTERQIELWLDDEGERAIMANQCLKRKLVPDDIARPILFFASDEAGACTNQTYVVDGGWI